MPNASVLGGWVSGGVQWGGATFSSPPQQLGVLLANGSVVDGDGALVGCVTALLYAVSNLSVALVSDDCGLANQTVLGLSLGDAAGAAVYNSSDLLGVVDPAGSGELLSVLPFTAPGGFQVPVGSTVGFVAVAGGVFSVTYGAVHCQLDTVSCSTGAAGSCAHPRISPRPLPAAN